MFAHAGSSLMLITDAQCQFADWYAVVHGQCNDGGDKDPGGFDGISEMFPSRFQAIVVSQASIREAVSSTFGGIFLLRWITQKR